MKVNLSRKQVYALYYVLTEETITKNSHTWFSMAMNRTIEFIEPEIKNLAIARNTNIPEYNDYMKQREELLISYAQKAENGDPIVVEKQYVFTTEEVKAEVTQKLLALMETYNEAITKRNQEISVYNDIIEEVIEVDICKCSIKFFPEHLSPLQLQSLSPMIKETQEELDNL